MVEIKEGTEFRGFLVSSRGKINGIPKTLVLAFIDTPKGLEAMRNTIKILTDKGFNPFVQRVEITL